MCIHEIFCFPLLINGLNLRLLNNICFSINPPSTLSTIPIRTLDTNIFNSFNSSTFFSHLITTFAKKL